MNYHYRGVKLRQSRSPQDTTKGADTGHDEGLQRDTTKGADTGHDEGSRHETRRRGPTRDTTKGCHGRGGTDRP